MTIKTATSSARPPAYSPIFDPNDLSEPLGAVWSRKIMVATSWAPYYFDEVWPLSGRSPLDTSIAMAARILYAAGILRSVHSGDLIAALSLPPSYVRDFVRVLARNKWEYRLLPSLIEATRYQLTREGMYDVLEATQANDSRSFLAELFIFGSTQPESATTLGEPLDISYQPLT